MVKKDENKASDSGAAPVEGQIIAAPQPDASAYVVQPTSYPLPAAMAVVGDVPEGRFQEEVLKGSDEEDSSTPSTDAHPAENQPAHGVTQEGGQPDTTGRKRS